MLESQVVDGTEKRSLWLLAAQCKELFRFHWDESSPACLLSSRSVLATVFLRVPKKMLLLQLTLWHPDCHTPDSSWVPPTGFKEPAISLVFTWIYAPLPISMATVMSKQSSSSPTWQQYLLGVFSLASSNPISSPPSNMGGPGKF